MDDHEYDVAVCWRIYPGVSKDPIFYKEDKFKLAQLSFRSFLKSAEGLKIKYFILLDGCPPLFENIFTENIPPGDLEIIHTDNIGNRGTFQKQLEILLSQPDAPLVFFAEDDYLYRPMVFKDMIQFCRNNKLANFITPYDHLDYFDHPIHAGPWHEINGHKIVWRSVVSTCLTFLTSKDILVRSLPVFSTYRLGNTDCSIWVTLTRRYSILSMVRFFFNNKECFLILKKAFKYSFRYFFAGKKFHLWSPVPSIATHLERDHIAPGVDWTKIKENILVKEPDRISRD